MLILAVDTSTRTGSAALLRDSEVLAEVSGYEETPYSTRLFRDIGTLQGKVGFLLDQIDVFAAGAGPGSFTGLRVGLTAVKAWAEVYGKPIAPISGLEAIAAEAAEKLTSTTSPAPWIAPFLDARRGQVFGAVYRRGPGNGVGPTLASDESILSVSEFLELVRERAPGAVELVSPTPEVLSAGRLKEMFPEARISQVSAALAPAIGRLAFGRVRRGDLVDSLRLDANYVRRSDAESAWKDG
jgi:tRNA threonylcarbamoyladenosine biosynthesis protein TsaB